MRGRAKRAALWLVPYRVFEATYGVDAFARDPRSGRPEPAQSWGAVTFCNWAGWAITLLSGYTEIELYNRFGEFDGRVLAIGSVAFVFSLLRSRMLARKKLELATAITDYEAGISNHII